MRVLITGATGLIGEKLSGEILSKGHELVVLGRSSHERFRRRFTLPCEYFQWEKPTESEPPGAALKGIDAVIHLAGESIAGDRWTAEKKRRIYDSRIKSTQYLVRALEKHAAENRGAWPKVIIGGSAVGFYGDRGEEELTEASSPGADFLAKTCIDWEAAWCPLMEKTRVALMRTGVVLSQRGGFLQALEPIFTSALGGEVGSGKQWVSWIHEDDLIALFSEVLADEAYVGPVNGVAPSPVRNSQLTEELGRAHHMPTFFPVPALAAKTALGEMATLALASQRVTPAKALQHGFSFNFPTLEQALRDIYSWKTGPHDRLFYAEQWVPAAAAEVFPFFCQEENLEALTPPFLNFKVLDKTTPKIEKGTRINYRLKIRGWPVIWQSMISAWRPNEFFQDDQTKGPYKKWEHIHRFRSLAGGTLLVDQVVYRLPLGFLSKGPISAMVRKDVEKIFRFRRRKIAESYACGAVSGKGYGT